MAMSPKDAAQKTATFSDQTVATALERFIDAHLGSHYHRPGTAFRLGLPTGMVAMAEEVAEKYRAMGWKTELRGSNLILWE